MMSLNPIPPVEGCLSIVVPALNEEGAIESTIRRCLEARPHLLADGGLADIEIIVVSDGSTDRTEAIAAMFHDVTVLAFDRNRGYGAAIKTGFEYGRGELVGFLDADGTCDPRMFADLCRALRQQEASVAIGSRMGPTSEMPRLRRIGNRIFAWLLGVLSKRAVGDTASGMRVIRRRALADLYPLPNGLHFTPAMSARVLLEDKIKLVEVPMPYAERVGRSKLSVLKDGVRFLRVIVQAALCYRPARLLLPLAAAAAAVAVILGLRPITFYLRFWRLEEWMIYRVLLGTLFAGAGAVLACTAIVSDRIAATAHGRPPTATGSLGLLGRLFEVAVRPLVLFTSVALAVGIAWPGLVQYGTTRHVDMHWSRAVAAALLIGFATTYLTTAFVLDLLGLIETQRAVGGLLKAPDRVRPGRPSGS
jgi:glycosyltransferase involved in cell wall biosynthesis